MKIMSSVLALTLALVFVLSGCLGADPDPSVNGDGLGDGGLDASAGNETGNQTTSEVLNANTSWLVGISGCISLVIFVAVYDLEDIDFGSVNIPGEARGGQFNATLTSTVPAVDWGIAFWAGEDLADAFFSMEDTLSGTVPSDADWAQFISCGGVDLSADFTVIA